MSERLTSVTVWMGREGIPCRDKIDNSLRVCACVRACMSAWQNSCLVKTLHDTCQQQEVAALWFLIPLLSHAVVFIPLLSPPTDARRPQGFRRVMSSSSAARSRSKQALLLTHFLHVCFLALCFVFPLSLPCLPATPPPASSPRSLSKAISW